MQQTPCVKNAKRAKQTSETQQARRAKQTEKETSIQNMEARHLL